MRWKINTATLAVLLLAQTSSTTNMDLTPVVTLLMTILPLFLMLMVLALIFKFIGSMFEGFSRTFFVKLAPAALLAQTTTSPGNIDFSQVANLLYAILPLFITLMIIVVIFKFFGNITEAFTRAVRAVKLNFRNAVALSTPLLLAQTGGSVDYAQQVVNQLTPILMTLITIVIIIALPILVFKVLAKSVLDTIRG